MKRLLGAVGASALLALGLAGPAVAQYDEPTTTTTTTTTSTTLPTTTTTDAPPPSSTSGRTSNPAPLPGEAVPIAVPTSSGAPTLDASKPAAAVMLPASGAADVPMPAPRVTQNADGTLSVSVTVPPSTPPGVYLIAVIGTDALGRSRAIIVPVVVRRTRAAAAASAPSATTKAVVLPASVRAEITQIQASVAAAGGEDAIVEAVLEDGATLDIQDSELLVSSSELTGAADEASSRPLVAALAVALGGAGLVLLRRRTPAISRRTR